MRSADAVRSHDQPLHRAACATIRSGAMIPGTGLVAGRSEPIWRRGWNRRGPKCWPTSSCGSSGGAVPAAKAAARRRLHRPARAAAGRISRSRGPRASSAASWPTLGRLDGQVDRVVVLGIGGSYMGARALFEACCHPYHNELSRADRGGRPRIYFEGNNVDNDAVQGLLDLLGDRRRATSTDRWGIVVISKSGGTLETAVAFRQFLAVLERSCGGDRETSRRARHSGHRPSRAGCSTWPAPWAATRSFRFPTASAGGFRSSRAVGLLPAAVMGLDVVKLLEGAAAMNAHFRTAPPGENLVLRLRRRVPPDGDDSAAPRSACCRPGARGWKRSGCGTTSCSPKAWASTSAGATPLTVVNTRDLHSRGQQHQEGRRDKLITNVIVDQRAPRSAVGRPLASSTRTSSTRWPTRRCPTSWPRPSPARTRPMPKTVGPTADLHLPRLDEASLGQFFQMLMLATVVEGRLIGINPYGQPGVEAYKKHMNANLRKVARRGTYRRDGHDDCAGWDTAAGCCDRQARRS